MNSKELLMLKAAIYEVGLLFNQTPSDEKITAYAKMLIDYSPEQVTFAFNQIINSGSAFFPSMAEILKHLRPAQEVATDKAPQIATEILQALRWYGPHDEVNMVNNVSPEARLVLTKLGYTGDIRNSENIDMVRAQLERLARSVLSSNEAQKKNERLEEIGINVLPMVKPGMQKLFMNPEGLA